MTEPRRSLWSALADEWDPDHPAIVRMRDALTLRPVEPTSAPDKAAVTSEFTPAPHRAPDDNRRGRISQLIARIKAGDLSAIDALRELIG